MHFVPWDILHWQIFHQLEIGVRSDFGKEKTNDNYKCVGTIYNFLNDSKKDLTLDFTISTNVKNCHLVFNKNDKKQ